jgi:hypothetical protein
LKGAIMLEAYRQHVAERAALGIPPLPLTAHQTAELIELLKSPPAGEGAALVELMTHRVPAGVDDAAKVKASYLAAVALGTETCSLISRSKATELLGTMLGGYNIGPMVDLLDDAEVGTVAAEGLKKTLLMFDAFHDVKEKALKGNANAKAVMQSWADGEWFTSRPEVPKSLTVTVFKVTGETETSVRFIPHKPDDYENVRAKRDESKSNNNIFPQTKFEGNSEYTVIYSRLNECLPKPESPFTINPYKNIDSASRGRPNEPNNMMTDESLRNAYTTHTMVSHQWPYPEDRRRFDWMQNKLI